MRGSIGSKEGHGVVICGSTYGCTGNICVNGLIVGDLLQTLITSIKSISCGDVTEQGFYFCID